jgi:hypothetical protein
MIPDGELLRSRVVTSLASPLEDVLERRLDGYAILSPQDALLGSADDRGVITFEAGIPALVYHAGTDRGGPPAIADIGSPPFLFELHALDADALELPHRTDALRVPPGSVAERLANDNDLAARIRSIVDDAPEQIDSVESFLDDETAITELQRTAREDAEARADEWGLSDAIED